MITLIQRVKHGRVLIENKIHAQIGHGYVILLGIFKNDSEKNIDVLIPKLINLRIMSDDEDKMNKSILETQGEILVVSQFTLCADTKKGRRPSFVYAKEPKEAERMYEVFVRKLSEQGIKTKTGKFGAMMEVQIFNDGPVTIILDSKSL